jgi:hypothetical protein
MIAADIIEGRSVGPTNQARGIRPLEFAQQQGGWHATWHSDTIPVILVCRGFSRLVHPDQRD